MVEQVRQTHALGSKQIVLALLASVVGTVLAGTFGAGQVGTFAGALIFPLVGAMFTTQGRGLARTVGIGVLTVLALVVTVTGFTVTDLVRDGESPVADREGTFWPPPGRSGPGSSGDTSALSAPEEERCPDTELQDTSACRFGLAPSGDATVQIVGVELDGPDQEDFEMTKSCKGTLRPGTACSVRLRFKPSEEGEREAAVVVRLPGGTKVVALRGKGVSGGSGGNGCKDDFVPRKATAGDNVCVTQAEQAQAAKQNQEHESEGRANEDGTCIEGFVWREATDGDHICVTPGERDDAAEQNAKHSERSAS
jgi:hypothetical protein